MNHHVELEKTKPKLAKTTKQKKKVETKHQSMLCVKVLTGFEERDKVRVFSSLGGKLLGVVDARYTTPRPESSDAFEERVKRFAAKKMPHEHNFSWQSIKVVLDKAQRRATAMWDVHLALELVRKEHSPELDRPYGSLHIMVPNKAILAEVRVLNGDASLDEEGQVCVQEEGQVCVQGVNNKEFVDLSLLAGLTRATDLRLDGINFHADKLPPLLKELWVHNAEIGRLMMQPSVRRVVITHSKGLVFEQLCKATTRLTIRYHSNLDVQLENLVSLKSLDLTHNNTTGRVPCELGLLTSLERLELCNNKFCNSIPTELGNMARLTSLFMSHNLLTGVLPTELGRLLNLEYMSFTNNNLRGAIPNEMANMACLSYLRLARNKLTRIPTELGNLHNLSVLDLAYNKFKHTIPTEIGNLVGLTELLLANNRLEGCIPTEFGCLQRLRVLCLANNRLEGCIPTRFGNLQLLEALNLANNRLGGCVPTELENLKRLRTLDLENNCLEG